MKRCSRQRRRHRSRNIRPPAATIRSCASSLKWLAPLRPLPKMTSQKKTDYICISKESEGPAPDTLDETLPKSLITRDIQNCDLLGETKLVPPSKDKNANYLIIKSIYLRVMRGDLHERKFLEVNDGIRKIIVTTKSKLGSSTIDGNTFLFIPSALYAYWVSKYLFEEKTNQTFFRRVMHNKHEKIPYLNIYLQVIEYHSYRYVK